MKRLQLFLALLSVVLTAQAIETAFLIGDDGLNRVALFNRNKELVWEYPVKQPYQVQALDNGNILTTSTCAVFEISMDKKVVWSFSRGENQIYGALRSGDTTIIADCTAGEILFVNKQGKIEKSFKTISEHAGHGNMRNLTRTSQNTLLVAHIADRTVREYSLNGNLVQEFEVPGAAYRGVRLNNENTLVGHSKGLTEFPATIRFLTPTEVLNVDPSDFPEIGFAFGTCAYRFPNGNTVQGNWFGHGGSGKSLFELDKNNELIWTIPDGMIGNTLSFEPVSDRWMSGFMDKTEKSEYIGAIINHPILFVVRNQYLRDHHNTATFFPSAKGETNGTHFVPGGALKILDPSTGVTTTLLETAEGAIRDPDVHFSGKKIVFSMRKDLNDSYHIYEINTDGTGFKQLTSIFDADDWDPIYMPSGIIVFTSTREPKYVHCNRHIMGNLYSMDSDGANINQISGNLLFDDHPSLMPDGRIMYSRWEYLDRNFGDAQGLWACNPDGTEHTVYYGNNTSSPGGVLDGMVIPGTQTAVGTFGTCHDIPWGAIAIIDRRKGVDGPDPVLRTWPANLESWVDVNDERRGVFDIFWAAPVKYEDPYPIADPVTGVGGRYFLCSRQVSGRKGRRDSRQVSGDHMALYLLDSQGEDIMLYDEGPEEMSCFDPMLIAPRKRPPDLSTKRTYTGDDGRFLVMDVYEGTHMDGIERGDVKYLRVVQSEEKRFYSRGGWSGQGAQVSAINWLSFENKRILGTVPVEADGSAHFSCPSNSFVFFQLLDENKMMVQSMRSGTILQPGESQSCIGCHDNRSMAPPAYHSNTMPIAALREPSQLNGWKGENKAFNYLSDVQPVWDAKCISCHDWGGKGAGKLVLAGDKGLVFNASYNELWRKDYTGAIAAGPAKIQQAKSWGSHNSILMETILSGHQGVKLTDEELESIATWIDLNGVYYPEFASNYPNNSGGRSPLSRQEIDMLQKLTGKDFSRINNAENNPGPMVSFDRPEKSPCLDGLSGDAYQQALAIIRMGKDSLEAKPRADMQGFKLANPIDIWRDNKYNIRREKERTNQSAIGAGVKVYDGQELRYIYSSEHNNSPAVRINGSFPGNTNTALTCCWGNRDGGDEFGNWQYASSMSFSQNGTFSLLLSKLKNGEHIYFRIFKGNSPMLYQLFSDNILMQDELTLEQLIIENPEYNVGKKADIEVEGEEIEISYPKDADPNVLLFEKGLKIKVGQHMKISFNEYKIAGNK